MPGSAAASWDAEYEAGRYQGEPSVGFAADFFTAAELAAVAGGGFRPVLGPRLDSRRRPPPAAGQWSQWEVI